MHFNPRAPCGARPPYRASSSHRDIFQSTRPMRGATRISPSTTRRRKRFQSTRPMRGATQQIHRDPGHFRFQSTRPMRGATVRQMSISAKTTIFQSTRPMRGATNGDPLLGVWILISIHAPHAGRDFGFIINLQFRKYFNPRAPCGARRSRAILAASVVSFQSTRPMRGATIFLAFIRKTFTFQSTRPMRGATGLSCKIFLLSGYISIHAPHAGRD